MFSDAHRLEMLATHGWSFLETETGYLVLSSAGRTGAFGDFIVGKGPTYRDALDAAILKQAAFEAKILRCAVKEVEEIHAATKPAEEAAA